jgi:hypothetical protein
MSGPQLREKLAPSSLRWDGLGHCFNLYRMNRPRDRVCVRETQSREGGILGAAARVGG